MADFYPSPLVNSTRMNKCKKSNVSDLTEVFIIFTLFLIYGLSFHYSLKLHSTQYQMEES